MPCRFSGHKRVGCKTHSPCASKKKGKPKLPLQIWSGKRVSNSRPQPWQGCALPTELFPHFLALPMQAPERISKPQIISLFFWLIRLQAKKLSLNAALLRSHEATSEEVEPDGDYDRIWRRGPESNRTNRICNPGHNRFATAPDIHISLTKKGSRCFPFLFP